MQFTNGRVVWQGLIAIAGPSSAALAARAPMIVLISGSTFASGAALLVNGSYPPFSNITIVNNTFASDEPCSLLRRVHAQFVTVIAVIDVVPIVLAEGAEISIDSNNVSTESGSVAHSIPFVVTSNTLNHRNEVRSHGTYISSGNTWGLMFTNNVYVEGAPSTATLQFIEGSSAWEFHDNWFLITTKSLEKTTVVVKDPERVEGLSGGTYSVRGNFFKVVPFHNATTPMYRGSDGNPVGADFTYFFDGNTIEAHGIGRSSVATMGFIAGGSARIVIANNTFVGAEDTAASYVIISTNSLSGAAELLVHTNSFVMLVGSPRVPASIAFGHTMTMGDASRLLIVGNAVRSPAPDRMHRLVSMSGPASVSGSDVVVFECGNKYFDISLGWRFAPLLAPAFDPIFLSSLPIVRCGLLSRTLQSSGTISNASGTHTRHSTYSNATMPRTASVAPSSSGTNLASATRLVSPTLSLPLRRSDSSSDSVVRTGSSAVIPSASVTDDEASRSTYSLMSATATSTLSVTHHARPIVPIPNPHLADAAATMGTALGAVAVVSAVIAPTSRLGVVGALVRIASCGEGTNDDDGGLPFLVHPLAFLLVHTKGPDGYYFAAVLGNTIIIPFAFGLLLRFVLPRAVLFARTRRLRFAARRESEEGVSAVAMSEEEAEVLASLGWPAAAVGPFVLLSEGTAAAIVVSFASYENYGSLIGVIGLIPLVAVCGAWAHTLYCVVPRRRLCLDAAVEDATDGAQRWRWAFQPVGEWVPLAESESTPNVSGLGDTNTFRSDGDAAHALASQPLGSAESATAPSPPKTAPLKVTPMLIASREAFLGGRWLYTQGVSFGCSLAVGALEGLPAGVFCGGRVALALVATAVQCGCGCLALVPAEAALEGLASACVMPLAVCALVLAFGYDDEGGTMAEAMAALEIAGTIAAVLPLLLAVALSITRVAMHGLMLSRSVSHRTSSREGPSAAVPLLPMAADISLASLAAVPPDSGVHQRPGASESIIIPPTRRWTAGRLAGAAFRSGAAFDCVPATPRKADGTSVPLGACAAWGAASGKGSSAAACGAMAREGTGNGVIGMALGDAACTDGSAPIGCVACERSPCEIGIDCVAVNTKAMEGLYFPDCRCRCKYGFTGPRCERPVTATEIMSSYTVSVADTATVSVVPSSTDTGTRSGTRSGSDVASLSVSSPRTLTSKQPRTTSTSISASVVPSHTASGSILQSVSAAVAVTGSVTETVSSSHSGSAMPTPLLTVSDSISSSLSFSAPLQLRRVVPIPRPPLGIAVETYGTVTGAVSVAIVGVLGATTARLGVVGALGRMVACGEDSDGDDSLLPFLVHPLSFRLVDTEDGDDGLYFAAVLGNTIFIPLLFGLLMRFVAPRVVLFVRTRQLFFSTSSLSAGSMTEAEALEAISWPSVIVGPFVLFSEGTAAAVVASFSSSESYGPLFGVIGLVPVLGICGAWAHALAFVIPRRHLWLSGEAAASDDDENTSWWQWLVSATAEWHPATAEPPMPMPNTPDVGCDDQNSTAALRKTQRDCTGANGENSLQIGNGETTGASLSSFPGPCTSARAEAAAVVTEAALARNDAFIGGRRWLYAEAANFGLALLIGVMKGLPEGTFCRGRVLVALVATVGQCACGCLALIPLEVALEGLAAACIIPLAVCAVLLTFRRTEGGDVGAGGDVAEVIAALEVIGSILAVAPPLLMPCVSFIATARASCSGDRRENDEQWDNSDHSVPLIAIPAAAVSTPLTNPPPSPLPQQQGGSGEANALICPQLQGDTAAIVLLDDDEEGNDSEHLSIASADATSAAHLFDAHSHEPRGRRGLVLSTTAGHRSRRVGSAEQSPTTTIASVHAAPVGDRLSPSPWAVANTSANIAAGSGNDYSDSEVAADRMASPYYSGAPLAATRQIPLRSGRLHAFRRAK